MLVAIMVFAAFPAVVRANSFLCADDEVDPRQDDAVYWLLTHGQLTVYSEETDFSLFIFFITNTNPYGFAEMYWDDYAGTYMTPNKQFCPRRGRWTSPDPHWTIHAGNIIFGDSYRDGGLRCIQFCQ